MSKIIQSDLPTEADIISIGPAYEPQDQYTELQLRGFLRYVSTLRSWTTRHYNDLRQSDPAAFAALTTIFSDGRLNKAHLYSRLLQPPPKDLLLRYLQRFRDLIQITRVDVDYKQWLMISPAEAQIWHPSPGILSPGGLRLAQLTRDTNVTIPTPTAPNRQAAEFPLGSLRRTISTMFLTIRDCYRK